MQNSARLKELQERFTKEPFKKHFSLKLEKIASGFVIISMPVSEQLVAVEGIANGGFIAMALNSAGVYAAMSVINSGHTRLLDISVQYLSPVFLGETVQARAEIVSQSKHIVWIKGDLVNNSGELKAIGLLKYNKPKQN